MSEAVTNSDIEDVLSSIRRLISENPGDEAAPDAPASAPHTQAPAAPPPEREKLVLTPALRVADAEKAPAEAPKADPAKAGTPTPSRAEGHPAADTLEGRIAELEAAIGNAPDEWEPDGSEAPGQTPELVFLKGAPEPEAAGAPGAQASEAEFVDMADDEPGFSGEVLNYSAAGLVLEAEEILEEDDEAADDAIRGDAQSNALEDDKTEAASEDGNAAAANDEILIDEDALRELVSQLVRSELKGRIGQRITRNIRRMVRREIKLALSLRDMD